MKVLHVHTDKKFISDSKRFEVLDIENTILYIYDKKVHRDFPENCLLVNKNRYCLKKIVEVGEGFDSVVLYDLDPIKIAIANALPQRITIIWRFFGHELYKINKSDYLSETTISSNLVYERNLLRKIKVSSNYRVNKYINEVIFRYDHDFHKAISKISYILGVFEEEYNFLKEKFSLPKFIQIPLRELSLQSNNEKKCKIIIGNSKNDFNNHLDILELLEGRDNSDCVMPISYGADSVYSKNIKERALDLNVNILEHFIPIDEYKTLLSQCSAMVSNSYRQMALGNLIIGIEHGVKLYLNKNNLVYHIFIESGILVYLIEDFSEDLKTGNLMLSAHEALDNVNSFNKAFGATRETFVNQIRKLL